MQVHTALYKWKSDVTEAQIAAALAAVGMLADKMPGIVEISTGKNTSPYHEGYSHVLLVRGHDAAAIDAYRNHPDHALATNAIEDRGVGVDFSTA